jgi:hypothetical protein
VSNGAFLCVLFEPLQGIVIGIVDAFIEDILIVFKLGTGGDINIVKPFGFRGVLTGFQSD